MTGGERSDAGRRPHGGTATAAAGAAGTQPADVDGPANPVANDVASRERPGLSRILNASVVTLCLLLVLWELWLAPLREGGSWLALKALPLALAIPGLLRGSRYTRQWLSLLMPFYLAEGIVRAFSEPGRVRVVSFAEMGLALAAFVAILTMLRRPRGGPSGPRGFTLIELIFSIAIITALGLIAYPGYVNYKVRANRAAAQALLIDVANRQQIYVLDARNYAGALADLGIGSVPSDIGAFYAIPDPVVDNTATPPTFMVSAVARPGTIQARDGDLSINSNGVRSGHW